MDGSSEDCIFCKIAQGTIPARFVYQDDEIVAFHDVRPLAPIHILIVPRKHIVSVAEVDDNTAPLVGRTIKVAAQIAREQNVVASGFRLLTNTGREGGQTVLHMHWHLLAGRQLKGLG